MDIPWERETVLQLSPALTVYSVPTQLPGGEVGFGAMVTQFVVVASGVMAILLTLQLEVMDAYCVWSSVIVFPMGICNWVLSIESAHELHATLDGACVADAAADMALLKTALQNCPCLSVDINIRQMQANL